MEPADRRHLLVIASQCDEMPVLMGLERAADELAAAFERYGDCQAGLRDGTTSIVGSLPITMVMGRVRSAIEFAAEAKAVLVLAFLGHGFVTGEDSSLYYMGSDSRPDQRATSINLAELIREAADRLDEAILVIDVASVSTPKTAGLVSGIRASSQLSLLIGRGPDQATYNLRVSRTLAEIIRAGVLGAGEFLTLADLRAAMRHWAHSLDVTTVDWDSRGGRLLWAARNRAYKLRTAADSSLEPDTVPRPLIHATAANDTPAAVDLLGIQNDAEALAALIAAKDTAAPHPGTRPRRRPRNLREPVQGGGRRGSVRDDRR